MPGYEGWTDNTDPVGAFDPWGNFYSLVLPYQFYYDKSGFKKYDNGSNQTNPTVPPEAIAVSVHPAASCPERHPPRAGSRRHNGHPDYVATAKNANTNDPDKQWIAIDTNPSSPHYGRVYAMWTVFVLTRRVIYESHADARPDGTHTDWSAPQVLPTVTGKRVGHVPAAARRTRRDASTRRSRTTRSAKGFLINDIYLISSKDGGDDAGKVRSRSSQTCRRRPTRTRRSAKGSSTRSLSAPSKIGRLLPALRRPTRTARAGSRTST